MGFSGGDKPACAHTGGKAPKACLASHEWTIKDALLTGLVVVERILAASLTEQQRFLQILEVLEREFDLVRGTLMLVGADGGTLHVQALLADEDGQPTVRETYRRGEGITGRVLETGLAVGHSGHRWRSRLRRPHPQTARPRRPLSGCRLPLRSHPSRS